MLDVKGVSKTIEGRCLFKDVNFSIPKGGLLSLWLQSRVRVRADHGMPSIE